MSPAGLVLSCEHARADVPAGLDLGVDAGSHHSWDPGALEVAQALALATGAPLVAGLVSRLVADANRRESHPDVIPTRSFGLEVPGNRDLDEEARQRRLDAFHRPFRRAISAEVARLASEGACLHLSVHSFTPRLGDLVRGLDVGVLFDPARPLEVRWAVRLVGALRAAGLDARQNEPYLGTDEGCTTWLRERWSDPSYAGLEVELSQALDGPRTAVVVDAVARLVERG